MACQVTLGMLKTTYFVKFLDTSASGLFLTGYFLRTQDTQITQCYQYMPGSCSSMEAYLCIHGLCCLAACSVEMSSLVINVLVVLS